MTDIATTAGVPVTSTLLSKYFTNLVNRFFKVLPMRESEEATLGVYMRSLQIELLGYKELIVSIDENPLYLSLTSILQFLIDNPDCPITDVRREIFKAISICNQLKSIYGGEEVPS